MISRIFEIIKQPSLNARKVTDMLLQLIDTDHGLLYINAVLRIVALLGLEFYFIEYRSPLESEGLPTIRLLLIMFFGYAVISGLAGVLHPEWFMRPWVKTIQSMFEISVYSLLYYLSNDPRSEVYFFYFLPLFFAVHFLNFTGAIGIILFAAVNLYVVLFNLSSMPISESTFFQPPFGAVLTLRGAILISMSLAYAVRRRASLVQELKWNRSQFGDLFRSMEDGIFIIDTQYRLLSVNPILKKRHGSPRQLQSCAEYFQTNDELYRWDLKSGDLTSGIESGNTEVYFTDTDGIKYRVTVSLIPLQGNNGHFNTAIAIVKDLTRQQQLLLDLDSQVKSYAKQINILNSRRTLLQKTYYELGKRLTSSEDVNSLMRVVVQETCDLLQAESSSLFLVNDEILNRKAIAGMEDTWLQNEQYKLGEGITGQVVLSQPGSKYGRPVRNNQVDQEPLVVQHYLKEYKAKLRSHQVCHLLAVPLNGLDRSVGVLRVINKLDSRHQLMPGGFNEDDQDFLSAIASMVAIALEKSRLLNEANDRYQQAVTLNEIGQKIIQAGTWSELRQVIVDETRAMLSEARKATIYLIDESTGDLVLHATSEEIPNHSGMPPLHHSLGIAGKALRERTVINVKDTRLEKEYVDRGGPALRSLMVAPLLANNRSIGVLSVDSDHVAAFNPGDQQLLGALATQASLAIEKARLYQREHERRVYSDTLLEVSRKINSNLDLKKMLPEILDELSKVVPYSSITIQTVKDDHLRVIACRGFKDRKKVLHITFPLNNRKYPNSQVVQQKKPLLVSDVQKSYPHFLKEAVKYHSGHIRGWMGIPLIHREKAIGIISLDHVAPGVYTEEMAQLVITFANQVAIAIVNANLFKEKTQQLVNMDGLFEASRTITSSIDLDDVLNKIVMLTKQVSGADHTGVVLLGERAELIDSIETHKVEIPLHQRARADGVTRRVIQSKKPVIYNHVQANVKKHNQIIVQAGYQSYAGLPIIKGDRILGVLFVHSIHSEQFDRQTRVRLLQALCNHAAIAIENALLYKEAAQQAETLAKLVETSNGLIQHTDLEELLKYCVQRAKDIFQVEDCSLYLRNRERNTVDLVQSSTIPAEIWSRRDVYMDRPGLTAFVARTGETLNFDKDEYRRHPAWSGHHEMPFEDHLRYLPSGKCHSLLISPLKDNAGENIGVLKLENKLGVVPSKKFSDFEVAMHKTFASHIGTAVERARLYQRLDQEARREARLALGYELHEIYNLIHGALVVRLEITKEKLQRNQLAEVLQELENMGKASRGVNSLLRWIHYDLRGHAMIEEKGLILTLDHVASLLKIPVTTKVSGREEIPKQIEYALYKIGIEALTNVAKHAGEETRTVITLKKHSGNFFFEVADNGFGFDESTIFHRTATFGLEGMKRWAESIGASLVVKSRPEQGTTVCVEGNIIGREGINERKN